MKTPIFVRMLSVEETAQLKAGLRSSNAFTLRRCQILLASQAGLRSIQIAKQLGCADQTVRNAIKAFNNAGFNSLQALSC